MDNLAPDHLESLVDNTDPGSHPGEGDTISLKTGRSTPHPSGDPIAYGSMKIVWRKGGKSSQSPEVRRMAQ